MVFPEIQRVYEMWEIQPPKDTPDNKVVYGGGGRVMIGHVKVECVASLAVVRSHKLVIVRHLDGPFQGQHTALSLHKCQMSFEVPTTGPYATSPTTESPQ